MKQNRRFLLLTMLALLLISVTVALSGCYSPAYYGISDTYINTDGELIVTYTNGTVENLGVVVGSDGQNGQDGRDGVDGKDGKDGIDGKDGEITISGDGQSVTLAVSKATRSAVSILASFDYRGMQYYSQGSGVIYKYDAETDGYFIITNYHVVYDSDAGISEEINVMVYGNEYTDGFMSAEYVGGSLNYDIAVLYIENNDVIKSSSAVCANVADSNKVTIGDTAIVVGNASGEGISATTGVISVDSETIDMTGADEKTQVSFRVMRTDASVNKGNSGGGIFNDKGELIGIVNAKIIDDGVEGIGYAIPSVVATNIADNIIDNCFGKTNTAVKRALLGITISVSESSSVFDSETGKISVKEKVYVVEATDTNLFGEDIKSNDVLVSVELKGHEKLEITRQFHVIDYLLQARVGDTGTLVVERENEDTGNIETVELNFTITEDCITDY